MKSNDEDRGEGQKGNKGNQDENNGNSFQDDHTDDNDRCNDNEVSFGESVAV